MENDLCAGKDSWPELVGTNGNEAAEIIKRENESLKEVRVIDEGLAVIGIYICDRVLVRVNDHGTVTQVPKIG